jgi:hypothetical protein
MGEHAVDAIMYDDDDDDNDDDNDDDDHNEGKDDIAFNYHLFLIIFLAQGKFQLSCFGSGKSGFHDNPASII